jgi:hypothetical protein
VLRHHDAPSPVWVFVDNIRRVLGVFSATRALSKAEEQSFDTALGRVVAHEVIHSLAPLHPHSAAGLMAPTLSRAGLIGPRQPLEASCVSSVLRGLAAVGEPGGLPPVSTEVTVGAMP